jgi:hypothetical protein
VHDDRADLVALLAGRDMVANLIAGPRDFKKLKPRDDTPPL